MKNIVLVLLLFLPSYFITNSTCSKTKSFYINSNIANAWIYSKNHQKENLLKLSYKTPSNKIIQNIAEQYSDIIFIPCSCNMSEANEIGLSLEKQKARYVFITGPQPRDVLQKFNLLTVENYCIQAICDGKIQHIKVNNTK